MLDAAQLDEAVTLAIEQLQHGLRPRQERLGAAAAAAAAGPADAADATGAPAGRTLSGAGHGPRELAHVRGGPLTVVIDRLTERPEVAGVSTSVVNEHIRRPVLEPLDVSS